MKGSSAETKVIGVGGTPEASEEFLAMRDTVTLLNIDDALEHRKATPLRPSLVQDHQGTTALAKMTLRRPTPS